MDRGDIFEADLDPAKGSEQRGRRRVLVITRALFNKLGVALVCPVTHGGNFALIAGWTVPLDYHSVHDLMRELRVGPYRMYGLETLRKISTISSSYDRPDIDATV